MWIGREAAGGEDSVELSGQCLDRLAGEQEREDAPARELCPQDNKGIDATFHFAALVLYAHEHEGVGLADAGAIEAFGMTCNVVPHDRLSRVTLAEIVDLTGTHPAFAIVKDRNHAALASLTRICLAPFLTQKDRKRISSASLPDRLR